MAKALTTDQVRQWEEDGYLAGIRFCDPADMPRYRAHAERCIETYPDHDYGIRYGPSDLSPWLDEPYPPFLDVIEDLVGPNIACITSCYRIKRPGSTAFAAWHQDEYTMRYDPPAVTCLLAITDLTEANGCLRVVPGSHKLGVLPHVRAGGGNYLSLSQGIEDGVLDESKAVPMELMAGEALLFHHRLAHASGVNRTDAVRIACFHDLCSTHARRMAEGKVAARLLRGHDEHGNFLFG